MEARSINFLRGVPADDALSRLIPIASEGYAKTIRQYGKDILQYGHFTGFKPLRDRISSLHGISSERIIAGNGGLEVISLFFKSLPKESTIMVEETSYDRVLLDVKRYGHHIIGIRLTPEGVDLDHFSQVVSKTTIAAFYGIPFHQNPTGINYTVENRKEVEHICKGNDILCVWDVCYQDLRYDGEANTPIDIFDWGPILTSSFTKTISPGTKCGYMIVPNHYVAHLSNVVANTRINPNLPTQAFIADFMESGGYDDFLNDLRKLYKPRMEALNKALDIHFRGAFPVAVSGGFFATLTLKNISRDKEATFIEVAKKAGVGIAPAWDTVAPNFQAERQEKGLFVRLTFPAFEPDKIEWGISTLKDVYDSVGGKN